MASHHVHDMLRAYFVYKGGVWCGVGEGGGAVRVRVTCVHTCLRTCVRTCLRASVSVSVSVSVCLCVRSFVRPSVCVCLRLS